MIQKILIYLLILTSSIQALELDTESPAAKELFTLFSIDPTIPPSQLLPILQKEWLQLNKERWQMDKRLEEKRQEALPLLQKLGFTDPVYPEKAH